MRRRTTLKSPIPTPAGELRFGRMLTWHKRIRIAADVAEGLTRMHAMHDGGREGAVHKDVRGSTILLDENFRGKVGNTSSPLPVAPYSYDMIRPQTTKT